MEDELVLGGRVLFWNVTRNAFEMPNDRRYVPCVACLIEHVIVIFIVIAKGNIIIIYHICGIVAILIKYVSYIQQQHRATGYSLIMVYAQLISDLSHMFEIILLSQ